MRVRIKICGLTRAEDALAAVDAGADALGFNFYDRSSRYIAPDLAARIIVALPPFVSIVGLFVDPTPAWVRVVLAQVPLQVLQFHGNEADEDCAAFSLPFIKAINVAAPVDGHVLKTKFPRASGMLLDAAVEGQAGGTGKSFDWKWFPRNATDGWANWILAGGLSLANVGSAVRELRPYAVDVSSSVESARGVKDHALMTAFCAAVRDAERDLVV